MMCNIVITGVVREMLRVRNRMVGVSVGVRYAKNRLVEMLCNKVIAGGIREINGITQDPGNTVHARNRGLSSPSVENGDLVTLDCNVRVNAMIENMWRIAAKEVAGKGKISFVNKWLSYSEIEKCLLDCRL